jgi:hypothetical protein
MRVFLRLGTQLSRAVGLARITQSSEQNARRCARHHVVLGRPRGRNRTSGILLSSRTDPSRLSSCRFGRATVPMIHNCVIVLNCTSSPSATLRRIPSSRSGGICTRRSSATAASTRPLVSGNRPTGIAHGSTPRPGNPPLTSLEKGFRLALTPSVRHQRISARFAQASPQARRVGASPRSQALSRHPCSVESLRSCQSRFPGENRARSQPPREVPP